MIDLIILAFVAVFVSVATLGHIMLIAALLPSLRNRAPDYRAEKPAETPAADWEAAGLPAVNH